ncbi:MAG: hypothetical protein JWR61_4002 [Ferruginibacter sp.]|uniref:hypothetical protein n=1 Tax=Ferruginibacter sp. TaxID=1940288 RepID=UPI0026598778|nr:hypothetical protein [Ferruginibacter sp.]MDB5279047.1 hypothetical protein [Ferruginibacter sp.]
MKKLFFFAGIALAAGCSAPASKEAETEKKDSMATAATAVTTAPAATVTDYPYTLAKPWQNWQAGDPQLAVTALKALRGFETGDIAASMANFADSVELRFDYMHAKLSKDSLAKFFTSERAKYGTINIEMQDWEPVTSADKKESWVTMWYKQKWTDKKGKADSLNVIDDCKMENGKVAIIDEKIQHFAVSKK